MIEKILYQDEMIDIRRDEDGVYYIQFAAPVHLVRSDWSDLEAYPKELDFEKGDVVQDTISYEDLFIVTWG